MAATQEIVLQFRRASAFPHSLGRKQRFEATGREPTPGAKRSCTLGFNLLTGFLRPFKRLENGRFLHMSFRVLE